MSLKMHLLQGECEEDPCSALKASTSDESGEGKKHPQFSGNCEELQIVEKKSRKCVKREVIVGGYRQEQKGRSKKEKFGQMDLVNQANFCVLSSLSL